MNIVWFQNTQTGEVKLVIENSATYNELLSNGAGQWVSFRYEEMYQ